MKKIGSSMHIFLTGKFENPHHYEPVLSKDDIKEWEELTGVKPELLYKKGDIISIQNISECYDSGYEEFEVNQDVYDFTIPENPELKFQYRNKRSGTDFKNLVFIGRNNMLFYNSKLLMIYNCWEGTGYYSVGTKDIFDAEIYTAID